MAPLYGVFFPAFMARIHNVLIFLLSFFGTHRAYQIRCANTVGSKLINANSVFLKFILTCALILAISVFFSPFLCFSAKK
jgi:hypothetical protein